MESLVRPYGPYVLLYTFLVFFIVSERFQRVLIGCALLWHRLTCEPALPVQMVSCLDAL